MDEVSSKLKPMPTARVSFLPMRSGDESGCGGGAIVSFDGAAVDFGAGSGAATTAKQVARAVNSHDALVKALEDILEEVGTSTKASLIARCALAAILTGVQP